MVSVRDAACRGGGQRISRGDVSSAEFSRIRGESGWDAVKSVSPQGRVTS